MVVTRREFAAAFAASVAAPAFLRRARAEGAPLKIGMCAPMTGPAAEPGRYAINGARLALEAVNKAGGVLDRQVELVIEDDQTPIRASSWLFPSWRRSPTSSPFSGRSARPRFTPWLPTS